VLDLCPEETPTVLERARATAAVGERRTVSGVALTAHPGLEGREANLELLRNLGLRVFAFLHGGEHPLPQILSTLS
jgi:hypothetical protein